MKNLCFIDIETTGLLPEFNEIIEIALIKTNADCSKELCRWYRKLLPVYLHRMHPSASAVNGFVLTEWKKSAQLQTKAFWEEFESITKGSAFVAHNSSFDRSFITYSSRQYGVEITSYTWIDTISLAWPLRLKYYSLDCILEHFGHKRENKPHSAMNGTEACKKIYVELMKKSK